MEREILLIGGGGHCKVVIDAIRKSGKFKIYGIIDPKLRVNETILGVKVLGKDRMIPGLSKRGLKYAFVSIGSIGDCRARKRIDALLRREGFKLPVIVHPKAIIASDVEFGAGTFVAAGAIVNPGVRTGRNTIINTCSSVDHDCIIGDFVHIAPRATLSGAVRIGNETHVGTGAKIIQSLDIGERCIIGAGQTIRHDMSCGEKSYGNAVMSKRNNRRTFIIAEAGVNHNGDFNMAKKMIKVAAEAGADAIKFQTFRAELLVSKTAQKASYQEIASGRKESQFNMLKRLELDIDTHKRLMAYCKKNKILFLSTPFDEESIELLVKLGLNIFKIPSGEITNLPYLRRIGKLGKKVILSTGMADMREVKGAVETLLNSGARKDAITVLHCNTEYPTPYKDVNLRAMVRMGMELKMAIGYSDHTSGIEVPIAAVAMGASIIEKHFTLDRKMKGPDHKASLEPDELRAMIRAIRNVEKAMGDGVKSPSPSERKNMAAARKSIVAARSIRKGEILTKENITVKRPGTGISPMRWDAVIGMPAKRDFKKDALLTL